MTNKNTLTVEKISGNIVDVINGKIYPATLEIKHGKIDKIKKENSLFETFILPGFIDSHIHIESSMVTPEEFAKIAVQNGVISVIADPHEIANVVGLDGINFMIDSGKKTPFKFYFGAPACVPATVNETSGAKIGKKEVEELLKSEDIKFLGEVMDFNGVIEGEDEIISKINAAKFYKKPVDGHAPNLSGKELEKYVNAGISTDHEACSEEEALEKIKLGMKILIREGSAAKDFDALSPIIEKHPDFCMFSSDDRHPNDLIEGHINLLVKKALSLGYDKMKVLKCACLNPVKHYNLDVGLLREGDSADFIEIDNFENLNVLKTVIDGGLIYEKGQSVREETDTKLINNFNTEKKTKEDFAVNYTDKKINVIELKDGNLYTKKLYVEPKVDNQQIISDTEKDILKIAVANRYQNSPVAIGFIKGFGLKKGAIASSVAHDSHNLIVVGTNDNDMTRAINLVIKHKGGLCAVHDDTEMILPLPIAGLMSDMSVFEVAKAYEQIAKEAKEMGSVLTDAFMTLSFMTLLVIPELKLSDRGLFDVTKSKFIKLDEE